MLQSYMTPNFRKAKELLGFDELKGELIRKMMNKLQKTHFPTSAFNEKILDIKHPMNWPMNVIWRKKEVNT